MTTATPETLLSIPEAFEERPNTSEFMLMCGPVYERIEDGRLTGLALLIQEKHRNLRGVTHGGMLMTLADSIIGDMIAQAYPEGTGLVTISMNSEFLRPAKVGDWVIAQAKVNKQGRRLAFADCVLKVGDNEILRASGVFAVVEPMGRR